jgi:hypothetical protein
MANLNSLNWPYKEKMEFQKKKEYHKVPTNTIGPPVFDTVGTYNRGGMVQNRGYHEYETNAKGPPVFDRVGMPKPVMMQRQEVIPKQENIPKPEVIKNTELVKADRKMELQQPVVKPVVKPMELMGGNGKNSVESFINRSRPIISIKKH